MKEYISQLYFSLSFGQKQYMFIGLAVLSVVLMIIGIKAWIRMFSSNEIERWSFIQKHQEFNIDKKGNYSIYIHGILHKSIILDWLPRITHKETKEIVQIHRQFIGVHTAGFDTGKVEMFGFKIKKAGVYTIEIKHGADTLLGKIGINVPQVAEPILTSNQENDLHISIRTSNALWQKVLLFPQMLCAFVGLFGSIFSIVLAFNPNAFIK